MERLSLILQVKDFFITEEWVDDYYNQVKALFLIALEILT